MISCVVQDPAPAATSTPEKPLSVSKLSLAEAAVQVVSGLDKRTDFFEEPLRTPGLSKRTDSSVYAGIVF